MLHECNYFFVDIVCDIFLYICLGVILFMEFYLFTLIISLVKFDVVNPIRKLIDIIKIPKDKEVLRKYIKTV